MAAGRNRSVPMAGAPRGAAMSAEGSEHRGASQRAGRGRRTLGLHAIGDSQTMRKRPALERALSNRKQLKA